MITTLDFVQPPSVEVRQDIIVRFVDAARRRSEYHIAPRRRSHRRYHRSWPLSVLYMRNGSPIETTAALHNASLQGIAFLTEHNVDVDSTIHIQLFCYETECPHVPAVVRHATPTKTGYLIGCEFLA